MSITPNDLHVIVLYGRKACEQLSSMVHYYKRALKDNGWSQIGLIYASPSKQAPSGWNSIPGNSIKASAVMQEDNCVTLDMQTIKEIQMRGSAVHFHFVCDDFETQEMDNRSIPQLIGRLHGYFDSVGLPVNSYVYLFLNTLSNGVKAQRAFLSALKETLSTLKETGTANVYPYFISQLQNDGSRCEPWLTQRAVMCEILAIMAGTSGGRRSENGKIYSLGYASLNANDGELHACRWHELLLAFTEECRNPVSNVDAWNMLTGRRVTAFDPLLLPHYAEEWLKELAKRQMDHAFDRLYQTSSAALDNLQRLISLDALPEGKLEGAVGRFYQLNFTYVLNQVPKEVEEQIKRFFEMLSRRPNAASFPAELLTGLSAELQTIIEDSARQPTLLYPQKNTILNRRYKQQCFEACERYYREASEAALVTEYAKRFREALPRIQEFLAQTSGIFTLIRRSDKNETMQLPPADKYPQYLNDIQSTIRSHRNNLFQSSDCLYDSVTGTPQKEQLDRLFAEAEKQLHNLMSSGFNGTFIDAISMEFNTQEKMDQFLGKYLDVSKRMFNSHYEQSLGNYEAITYYDDDLKQGPKPQVNTSQCYINNDNVEQVNRYTLAHDLDFYLEANEQGRPYFAEGALPLFPDARPVQEEAVEESVEERSDAVDQKAPSHNHFDVHLRVTSDFRLAWDWGADLTPVCVYLNGQQIAIIQKKDYNSAQGLVIAGKINSGKNYVRIVTTHGKFVGELTFLGRPVRVNYNLSNRRGGYTLKIDTTVHGTGAIEEMVLCETSKGQSVYYPLRVGALSRECAVYENLQFSGSVTLIPDPELQRTSDPFRPKDVYQGALDATL